MRNFLIGFLCYCCFCSVGFSQDKRKAVKKYSYQSLKGLSFKQIAKYMGRGKRALDLKEAATKKSNAPVDFWNLKPKLAAYKLIKHFGGFVDFDQNEKEDQANTKSHPPKSCSVAFSYDNSGCYSSYNEFYFLRVDPKESYLMFGSSGSGAFIRYNFILNKREYLLKYIKLSYKEAKHVSDIIWWLNYLEEASVGEYKRGSGMKSTADGRGRLNCRLSSGRVFLNLDGRLCFRMNRELGQLGKTEVLNLSSHVLETILPEYLEKRWSDLDLTSKNDFRFRHESPPVYSKAELKRMRAFCKKSIQLFSLKEDRISFSIFKIALLAMSEFGFVDLLDSIEDLKKNNSVNYDDLSFAKYNQLLLKKKLLELRKLKSGKKKRSLERYFGDLRSHKNFKRDYENFVVVLDLTIKQLRTLSDISELMKLATSKTVGNVWALQKLKAINKNIYLKALEWWLENTDGVRLGQVYDEIAKYDPELVIKLTKGLSEEKRKKIAINTFTHLKNINELTDEKNRVLELIKVLLKPETRWQDRSKVFELLFPTGEELRYDFKEVDEALLRFFEPDLPSKMKHFSTLKVCRVLVKRNRSKCFDLILSTIQNSKWRYGRQELFGTLIYLYIKNKDKLKQKMLPLLQKGLQDFNDGFDFTLWSVWSSDMRELKPILENAATESSEEFQPIGSDSFESSSDKLSGKFHLPRKIVSIWNEEDSLTKGKLLLAFVFQNLEYFYYKNHIDRELAFYTQIKKIFRTLNKKEKKELSKFLDFCASKNFSNIKNLSFRILYATEIKEKVFN